MEIKSCHAFVVWTAGTAASKRVHDGFLERSFSVDVVG